MDQAAKRFVPAAGHDWLLPLYDPFWRLLQGGRVRAEIIERAAIRPGDRVLDVGCGTGSLAIDVKRRHGDAEVTALDPDPKALARAGKKARRAGVDVRLEQGFGDALPFEDASFDRVLSTFMFHHLDEDVKRGTLREVRRVLAPGGHLHLVDFGASESEDGHHHGPLARLLHSHETFEGNQAVPELLAEAGLADVRELGVRKSIFGRFVHWTASTPRA